MYQPILSWTKLYIYCSKSFKWFGYAHTHILNYSNFKEYVDEFCYLKYNIVNILDNDVDAITSRLFYVQNHEPTSWLTQLYSFHVLNKLPFDLNRSCFETKCLLQDPHWYKYILQYIDSSLFFPKLNAL